MRPTNKRKGSYADPDTGHGARPAKGGKIPFVNSPETECIAKQFHAPPRLFLACHRLCHYQKAWQGWRLCTVSLPQLSAALSMNWTCHTIVLSRTCSPDGDLSHLWPVLSLAGGPENLIYLWYSKPAARTRNPAVFTTRPFCAKALSVLTRHRVASGLTEWSSSRHQTGGPIRIAVILRSQCWLEGHAVHLDRFSDHLYG